MYFLSCRLVISLLVPFCLALTEIAFVSWLSTLYAVLRRFSKFTYKAYSDIGCITAFVRYISIVLLCALLPVLSFVAME